MTKKELVALIATTLATSLTPLVGKPFTKENMDAVIANAQETFGPKAGGGFKKIDIEEIIKVENGKTVKIFDTVASVWLPATSEFFYEDKKNPNAKLNGLKNHSKAREKVTKENVKHQKMAKDLVWVGSVENDILTKEQCTQVLKSVPKIDYKRIKEDGSVTSNTEIAKFESTVTELKGKVDAKIAEAKKAPAAE